MLYTVLCICKSVSHPYLSGHPFSLPRHRSLTPPLAVAATSSFTHGPGHSPLLHDKNVFLPLLSMVSHGAATELPRPAGGGAQAHRQLYCIGHDVPSFSRILLLQLLVTTEASRPLPPFEYHLLASATRTSTCTVLCNIHNTRKVPKDFGIAYDGFLRGEQCLHAPTS